MAKKKNRRRRRSFSEKALMVLGIFIVISMVLATVASVLQPG
jgi:predicted nucleic acid-binding Zn ribbon protein